MQVYVGQGGSCFVTVGVTLAHVSLFSSSGSLATKAVGAAHATNASGQRGAPVHVLATVTVLVGHLGIEKVTVVGTGTVVMGGAVVGRAVVGRGSVMVLREGVAQGPHPGHFLMDVTVTGQSKDWWGEGSPWATTSSGL
jgi:hypothetical protein